MRSLIVWTIILFISQAIPMVIAQEGYEWASVIYGAIITGVIVSIFTIILLLYRLKKHGILFRNVSLNPSQSKTLEADLSFDEIISIVRNEFGKGVKKILPNQIQINTFNLFGWNKLFISLSKNNNDAGSITISSKPIIGVTLFDFGEGLILIDKVEKLLVDKR